MSALCRACDKPIGHLRLDGGTLYHFRACFALKPRTDGRGCQVCNRVKTGPAYCSTPVCKSWRARAARARTELIKAGVIEVAHRCPCGRLTQHEHDVGRPREYCSDECRAKEYRVRQQEDLAARRHANPPRDTTKCSKCNVNDRPVKGDGTLRSWCKPCENQSKRERPSPNGIMRSHGLAPGKALVFRDAVSASR